MFCFVLWNFASQGATKVDLHCSQAASLLWWCAGTPKNLFWCWGSLVLGARNQANRLLGFIARSIESRTAEVILKLYLALVRPHLDYAVWFGPRIIEWI